VRGFRCTCRGELSPFVQIWIMVTPVRSIPLLDCFEFGQEPLCLIQKIAFNN